MSGEPGGRANKDGNEFERLWVAYCALEVLAGKAQSLSYARSAAFIAKPDALIDPLAEDPSQIGRFLEAIGVLAARFGELSGPKLPWDLDSKLTTLILGLYESTEDAEIRRACP